LAVTTGGRRRSTHRTSAQALITVQEAPLTCASREPFPVAKWTWQRAFTALVASVGASSATSGAGTSAQLAALAIVAIVVVVALTRLR